MQIGFFPEEKAFALRYQTAGMLETVLRQGVLGEDDTDEESPKSVFLFLDLTLLLSKNFFLSCMVYCKEFHYLAFILVVIMSCCFMLIGMTSSSMALMVPCSIIHIL